MGGRTDSLLRDIPVPRRLHGTVTEREYRQIQKRLVDAYQMFRIGLGTVLWRELEIRISDQGMRASVHITPRTTRED